MRILHFCGPVVMGPESRPIRDPATFCGRSRHNHSVITRIVIPSGTSKHASRWAADAAERFAAELIEVEIDPADDDPAATIVRAATERRADLIVLSDVGMHDRAELLMRSVSEPGVPQRPLQRGHRERRRRAADVADEATDDGSLLGRVTQIGRVFARHVVGDASDEADGRAGCARRSKSSVRRSRSSASCCRRVSISSRPRWPPSSHACRTTSPRCPAQVAAVLERELGVPLEDVFSSFDPAPLAAGTIAQVHRATLPTGERVVVKVQRPNAERQIRQDTSPARDVRFEGGQPPCIRPGLDIEAVHEHLAESLQRELDFTIEAASIVRFREGSPRIRGSGPEAVSRALDTPGAGDGRGTWHCRARGSCRAGAGPGRTAAAHELLRAGPGRWLLPCRPASGHLRWADDRLWFLDFGMVGEVSRRERELMLVL